jgi:hypothetical protein
MNRVALRDSLQVRQKQQANSMSRKVSFSSGGEAPEQSTANLQRKIFRLAVGFSLASQPLSTRPHMLILIPGVNKRIHINIWAFVFPYRWVRMLYDHIHVYDHVYLFCGGAQTFFPHCHRQIGKLHENTHVGRNLVLSSAQPSGTK